MRKYRSALVLLLLMAILSLMPGGNTPTHALDGCEAVITALANAGGSCGGIRDEVCYGHRYLNAGFKVDVAFSSPGHRANVADLVTLNTVPDEGVALMRVGDVTLVLYGSTGLATTPTQGFTLSMNEEPICEYTPSAMMLQTETGTTGYITVNGVEIKLGSTALITMESAKKPIAFVRMEDTNGDGSINFEEDFGGIYVMNVDGTGQANLTNSYDWRPAWSPDGRRIAFYSFRDGNFEIYVVNADGTGQTRLTYNPAWDRYPAWSPDGRRIAFVYGRGGNEEIYVMNADGTGQTRLTYNSADAQWPTWSPDGQYIAFMSDLYGNWEIHVINADGTGQTNLTKNPATDWNPAWSPDGQRIAFASDRDGNFEIYVMNADGTQTNLTNNPADDDTPTWSPDGQRIAFTSKRDGNREIYVMNADGTGQIRLTNNQAWDMWPAWSPAASPIEGWMTVTNVEGYVEVSLMGGPWVLVGAGQQVRIQLSNQQPLCPGCFEGPTPAGPILDSPVVQSATEALRQVREPLPLPTADTAPTDLFPQNLPQGKVYVRITNNGPDTLTNASVQLVCTGVATAYVDGAKSAMPVARQSITVNLNPGQTTEFDTGISIDTTQYWYVLTCNLERPDYHDPNPTNESYSETIPTLE